MNRRAHSFAALLALASLLAPARAEPIVLYEKESPFGMVIVTEEDGLRTLLFEKNGARQSVVKLGDPEYLDLPYGTIPMPRSTASTSTRQWSRSRGSISAFAKIRGCAESWPTVARLSKGTASPTT
jgi:hypothetical protein